MRYFLDCSILVFFALRQAFSFVAPSHTRQRLVAIDDFLSLKSSFGNWDENFQKLKSIQEHQIQGEILDALFLDDTASSSETLLDLELAGQTRLPVSSSTGQSRLPRIVLVLVRKGASSETPASSLLVPLDSMNQLKLVSFALAKRPLSKSVMLSLNTLLVNRDGALYDNLPWSSWSVDPQKRNRDAAGNTILERFHLGKRDAYNRFLGKDWQGKSLAIGNLALRLKYLLENDGENKEMEDDEESNRRSLAIRVAQLSIRELQMEQADVESQIAVVRKQGDDDSLTSVEELEESLTDVQSRIQHLRQDLDAVTQTPESVNSFVANILDRVANWTTSDGTNAAPYRGAMGYAPKLDSKQDVEKSQRLQYTSPYDLLKEILDDQLNAKVIGCVLENTSLLRGNTAIGGALVLQRIPSTKTAKIGGEDIDYNDYDEDFGNQGVKGGETMIVECDCDEAIAISVAYGIPLKVEAGLFDRSTVVTERPEMAEKPTDNIIDVLSMFRPIISGMSLQMEGEPEPASASPISIPRSTNGLYESFFETKERKDSSLYPDDNPVRTLDEFDQMTNEDKAKTLLEMSNFAGRLPRPRVIRTAQSNPLDELMLPLIDESVRRQYLIREAERRGDKPALQELQSSKSRRQEAKERADRARKMGQEELAEQWENEAEFLATLRADFTQDEGSYSRFLDRDDWYERDRQATAKRVKKSSFGNLLDGID